MWTVNSPRCHGSQNPTDLFKKTSGKADLQEKNNPVKAFIIIIIFTFEHVSYFKIQVSNRDIPIF